MLNTKNIALIMLIYFLMSGFTAHASDFITIASPTNNQILAGPNITTSGTSSQAFFSVRITINSTIVGSTTTNSNGDWSFTTYDVSNGAYTITAKLISAALGILASASVPFTIQKAPSIVITSPESNEMIIASSNFIKGYASLPNTLVNISLNSSLITTATTDDDGYWQAIYNPTTNGLQTLQADLVSSNVVVASAIVTVTADAPFYFPSATTLGAGILIANSLGMISSVTANNHAILVGDTNGIFSSLSIGSDGQLLIGSTNNNPQFASLSSTGSSVTFTPGAGSLNLEAVPVFGKVVRVDTVFGNDSLGARNGPPFATINAALAAAQSGDIVWIFPGTYAESFTIPTGVTVQGVSTGAVKITKAVTTATDLVTMGETTRLSEVALTLTSTMHVQLRGIVFPGTTTSTAKLRTATLLVDNSGAGAGTSDVYGVHAIGTGTPGEETSAIRATTIKVLSDGLGAKRGILVDSNTHIHIRDTNVVVDNNGGGGSAIGIETNNPSAFFTARSSTIDGETADISQTQGIMTIVTTDLLHSNANGFGFDTKISPSMLVWADSAGVANSRVFLRPGTFNATATEVFVVAPQPLIVKNLSVQLENAPDGVASVLVTLRKGTGALTSVDTLLTVTVSGTQTFAQNTTQSVSYATGDRISVAVGPSTTGNAANINVGMELY